MLAPDLASAVTSCPLVTRRWTRALPTKPLPPVTKIFMVQLRTVERALSVRAMSVGECVWIRVSDTGIGIDEEDIALIFHPLVRGRDLYARAQDGVGLGLAITRKLARSMDGELSVASDRDRGSTFTIALPRGRQARGRP